MTRINLAFAASAALILGACSNEQEANVVTANDAEVEMLNDAAVANEPLNATEIADEANIAPSAEPAQTVEEAERPREAAPAREKAERPQPRQPEPREEPADPHAGHDMNNMSH